MSTSLASLTSVITSLPQGVQVFHDRPDLIVAQLTAVLAAEGGHDDTRLDPGSVRDPLEEPVRIARGLGPLVLVVERALDPVPADVRRLGARAGLRRIQALR